MSFQESAESLRSKLHLTDKRPTVLAGIAIAAVVVIVFAVQLIVQSTSAETFSVESASEPARSEPAAEEEPADKTITVHVVGAVADPGVYTLPEGARANDAVASAGGLAEDADAASCNLARTVSDGEQIVIARVGEQPTAQSAASTSSSASTASSGLVNINTATATELETLSGIGPSTAQKIIDDRTQNGPFTSKEDLKRVSGIGDKKYASLEPYITV